MKTCSLALLMLVAMLGGTSLAQRGSSGELTILYWQASSTLNPYLSGGTKDINAASLVLEPLARYTPSGEIVPWLVDELPTVENGGVSEDLTTITWTLTEGLLWSDGTPVTAEDVAFSGEYCLDPASGCNATSNFENVESIEALDERTVQITFDVPKPYPYGPFVGSISPIIQKAQFADCLGENAQNCTDQNFGPIGTGPFAVAEFLPNDVVVYEANENYRNPDQPAFANVTFKGGGDAASAARAVLETGEADWAWNLQVEPEILDKMEAKGKGTLVATFGTSVERLMVNLTNPDPALGDDRSLYLDGENPHPFLGDPAVRQALSMAIDRDVLAEIGYGQAGQATCNVLPAPEIYASTNNNDCLLPDVDGANALLDEAGWAMGDDGVREKDGVRLSILYQTSTNSVRQGTQALVKEMWKDIGVETELRNIDASVFFGGDISSPDTYGKFYADIEMYTNNFNGTDPEAYMANWGCSEISDVSNDWLGNNIPRFCSEEYDVLIEELSKTASLDERANIAIQMNDILMQGYVMIPLVHRGDVSAYANSLKGTAKNSWDSELWNIAEWYREE